MSEVNGRIESLSQVEQTQLVSVDEQKQERIHRYLQASLLVNVISLGIAYIAFAPFITFLGLPFIRGILSKPWLALQPLNGWYPLRILAMYFFCTAPAVVLFLPALFLTGYFFPRLYTISQRTFRVWLIRRSIGMRNTTLRWLCMLQCCGLLIVIQPNTWWLWMAALLLLVTLCKAYLAPIYFFPRIYKSTPIVDEQLVQTLSELTLRSKTSIRQFFKIERKARNQETSQELRPNGYLAGWGKTSSIFLTDGLINHFTHAEIKAILAHELGHHVSHDFGKKCLLNFFLTSGALLIYGILYHWIQALFFATIDPKISSSASMFSVFICFLVFIAVNIAACVFQINRKYSQQKEYWADEFALHLTGDAFAFKCAMIRLMNLNDNPLTLSPHLAKGRSHPTTFSRLQHADEFAARIAASVRPKN